MPRNRVMLESRNCRLSEQFGYDYACRLFGKEAIDSLPLLQSGPNKGKPKGFLIWRKAITAGYVSECAGPCVAGGLVDAWIGVNFGSHRNDALYGTWIGRTQSLAGSRTVLTKEYRDGEIRRHAEQAKVWEEEKAEILARLAEQSK